MGPAWVGMQTEMQSKGCVETSCEKIPAGTMVGSVQWGPFENGNCLQRTPLNHQRDPAEASTADVYVLVQRTSCEKIPAGTMVGSVQWGPFENDNCLQRTPLNHQRDPAEASTADVYVLVQRTLYISVVLNYTLRGVQIRNDRKEQ